MPVLICRKGNAASKAHVSIPERVLQELRRACAAAVASLEREAQKLGKDAERVGADTNALLNGQFGHISPETKKWLAEQAKSLGRAATKSKPSRLLNSADDIPSQNTDLSKLTRGTGDQTTIPIPIEKGKKVNILINYTISPTYNKIDINAAGAGAELKLKNGGEVRAAVLVEKGGAFGAYATIKWEF